MMAEPERFERAVSLAASGKAQEAAAIFREILDAQPAHLAAAKALADIVESGAAEGDGAAARRRAVAIEAESTYKVARTALQHGRYDVARRCYLKVLELDPDHGDAIWGLAESCYGDDARDEALRWYQAYLDRYPDNSEARHMVAALGDGPAPVRASDAYVRETFDRFADDFDKQLIEDLDYRAPRLAHDLFVKCSAGPPAGLDILDAGCGTGLSGVDFRPYARRLVGIDLSPEMLKLAGARGIYDELAEEEIAAALRARPASFDLVLAVDVFCYIGDLAETLAAAAVALRPEGRLVFSVEAQSKRGFSLTASGRYAHKPAYVRKAAKSAGFKEISGFEDRIRTEYGAPVAGYIVLVQKAQG